MGYDAVALQSKKQVRGNDGRTAGQDGKLSHAELDERYDEIMDGPASASHDRYDDDDDLGSGGRNGSALGSSSSGGGGNGVGGSSNPFGSGSSRVLPSASRQSKRDSAFKESI